MRHPSIRLVRHAIAALSALTALALLFACAGDRTPAEPGAQTTVILADAPFPYATVAQVNVYVERIDVSTSTDTLSPSTTWITVAAPARAFNLLDLQNGRTALLGGTQLAAAQYRSVRVVIDAGRSGVVDRQGKPVTVHWGAASGGPLALQTLVQGPIQIGSDGGSIVLDFDVGRSFLCLDDTCAGGLWFSPVIRALDASIAGTLTGTVRGTDGSAVADATIEVLPDSTWLGMPAYFTYSSGRTDATGQYRIPYLLAGRYMVRVTPPAGGPLLAAARTNLTVSAGQATAAGDVVLQSLADARLVMAADTLVYVGDSLIIQPKLRAADGTLLPLPALTWYASDTTVIRLVPLQRSAYVQVLRAGTATLTATTGTQTATMRVTAQNRPVLPVARVTVSPTAWTAGVGDSVGFYVTPFDSTGRVLSTAGHTVTWTVSDTTVASVRGIYGASLLLTARRAGTATVTATCDGKSATATLTVNAVSLSDVSISMTSDTTLLAGDSAVLRATTRTSDGRVVQVPITWSSSDTTVVWLLGLQTNDAFALARKVGTATVQASVGLKAATMRVTVQSRPAPTAVARVVLAPATISAVVGDSLNVTATLYDSAGHSLTDQRIVTWTLSDSTVATLQYAYGRYAVLKARKSGTATLSAVSEGKTGTTTLTVK